MKKEQKNNKSITRFVSVQTLYCLHYDDDLLDRQIFFLDDKHFNFFKDFENKIEKNEFDQNFLKKLLNKYKQDKVLIDQLIKKNLNKKWDIKRLPIVLYSILSIAVSEMIIDPKIPLGVIITEYINVTNCFFYDDEFAFVNAVLEKIYKNL
tara:strand:+ start:54 stop:506 length:453 start_codon:yes stop_codon:yes gene_type:complete